MARIYTICSSSSGNSTFIGTRGHGILVDAGCSFRMLKNALKMIDTDISGIEAVFITHEHIDHVKALEQIVRHTNIPIFATVKTAMEMKERNFVPSAAHIYDARAGYTSAAFEVSCFETSHDAADSVGFKVCYKEECFGVCTDTGVVTAETEKALLGCRAVLIESNYDEETLRKNPNPRYGPELKRRILSAHGHLSNSDCAAFAEKLVKSGTRHLILGHLSQENNSPETAFNCTKQYLESKGLFVERDYTLNVAPVNPGGDYIAV